jgi:hypothetical protein
LSAIACKLVARCFAARTGAHIAHLTTTSYAQHMALGDFYDAIASAADEFFECWMGVHGKPDALAFPFVRVSSDDPVVQLTELRTWIVDHREDACESYDDDDADADEAKEKSEAVCTELANLIDNILAVVDRTLYKLRHLK